MKTSTLLLAVALALPAPAAAQFSATRSLSPLTVTAKRHTAHTFACPGVVSTLEGTALTESRKSSLGETLAAMPGVSAQTTGSGIAKPVIRGLTSQRVVSVVDGLRQEGQQWGDEHGPELSVLDLERVEVLRGPQSLLYGPDALGGVVRSSRRGAPLEAKRGEYGIDLETEGRSANRSGSGSVTGRMGLGGGLSGIAGGSVRRTGNIETPKGGLFNSGVDERTARAGLGLKKDWGHATLDYDRFEQSLQIHEDPAAAPTGTKHQRVEHDRARGGLTLPFGSFSVEMLAGWQRNRRREFETAESPDSKLRLVLDTFTQDLRLVHDQATGHRGVLGVVALQQRNDTQGVEKLIPGFTMSDFGAFALEEFEKGSFTVSGGARFDSRRLWVKREDDLGVAAQTRNYQAFTGSLGAGWRFLEGWSLAVSAGMGWRAPTPFELFVNGEHEGTRRFERGSNALKTERSLNTEASLRRESERLTLELTGFRHRVADFVYAAPAGTNDPDSGLPIFDLRQAAATIAGAEAGIEIKPLSGLALNAAGTVLHARNEATGRPLPQIPQNKLRLGAKLTRAYWAGLTEPFLSATANLTARQHRVEANEATTAKYATADFSAGATVPWLAGGRVELGVENAFDAAYRDHLSRYRAYALAPGRNAFVKYSLRFGSL